MARNLSDQLESACNRMNGEFTEDANPRTSAPPSAGCELGDREIQVRDDIEIARLITNDTRTTILGARKVQASNVDDNLVVAGNFDDGSTAKNHIKVENARVRD